MSRHFRRRETRHGNFGARGPSAADDLANAVRRLEEVGMNKGLPRAMPSYVEGRREAGV